MGLRNKTGENGKRTVGYTANMRHATCDMGCEKLRYARNKQQKSSFGRLHSSFPSRLAARLHPNYAAFVLYTKTSEPMAGPRQISISQQCARV